MDTEILQATARQRQNREVRRAARSLAARFQDSLFDDVDAVCNEYGVRRPGGFLAEVMAGHDPRSHSSRVRALVDAVEARGATEMPTEDEWFELAEAIKNDPRYDKESITLDRSESAAKALLPVLYSAKHSVEATADIAMTPTPLTADEIKEFRMWFDGKY